MKHRIFIAINLPESIKKKLLDYEFKWPELPGRWARKENLHITLSFLGYLTDEEILQVCKAVKEAAQKQDPFFVKLNRVVFAPPGKPPRMIWAEGEKSEELGRLQNILQNSLVNLPVESEEEVDSISSERQGGTDASRTFTPHVTLCRLKQWEFRVIEPEERPQVNEEINFNFEVNSIEIMESELKRGGPTYCVLESAPLNSK